MPDSAPPSRLQQGSPFSSHIPALDGLRGIAALGVICSHVFPGTATGSLTRALNGALAFGATGVDLFFVLSGFLITGILVDTLADDHFFRKFYARRVLRIFPLYYAVIACYGLGTLLFGMHYQRQLLSMALYLQNTGLIAAPIYAYAGPSRLPLSHFWSLAVEEQFYFVWPLVVFLLRRRRSLLLVCGLILLVDPLLRAALLLHGWSYFPVHNNTLLRADALLGGASIALLLRSRFHNSTLRWSSALTLLGVVATFLTFVPGWFFPRSPFNAPALTLSLRYSALVLLYVGVLITTLKPGAFALLCGQSALRFVGKYSYGLYVLHALVFAYLQAPIRKFLASHVTPNKAVGVGMTGLLCFALSLAAAVASFNLYEAPFLRLKRFFSYRRVQA